MLLYRCRHVTLADCKVVVMPSLHSVWEDLVVTVIVVFLEKQHCFHSLIEFSSCKTNTMSWFFHIKSTTCRTFLRILCSSEIITLVDWWKDYCVILCLSRQRATREKQKTQVSKVWLETLWFDKKQTCLNVNIGGVVIEAFLLTRFSNQLSLPH